MNRYETTSQEEFIGQTMDSKPKYERMDAPHFQCRICHRNFRYSSNYATHLKEHVEAIGNEIAMLHAMEKHERPEQEQQE